MNKPPLELIENNVYCLQDTPSLNVHLRFPQRASLFLVHCNFFLPFHLDRLHSTTLCLASFIYVYMYSKRHTTPKWIRCIWNSMGQKQNVRWYLKSMIKYAKNINVNWVDILNDTFLAFLRQRHYTYFFYHTQHFYKPFWYLYTKANLIFAVWL